MAIEVHRKQFKSKMGTFRTNTLYTRTPCYDVYVLLDFSGNLYLSENHFTAPPPTKKLKNLYTGTPGERFEAKTTESVVGIS